MHGQCIGQTHDAVVVQVGKRGGFDFERDGYAPGLAQAGDQGGAGGSTQVGDDPQIERPAAFGQAAQNLQSQFKIGAHTAGARRVVEVGVRDVEREVDGQRRSQETAQAVPGNGETGRQRTVAHPFPDLGLQALVLALMIWRANGHQVLEISP